MFKEIAVDPAAVSTSYRDFSYIIEKFGISEGRLIAAFPSKWKKFVYDAAQTRLRGTIELTKLEHRLRDLPSEVFMSRGRPGEGCTQNWLHAAVQEHRRVPFEAIIASERIDEAGVILATELDGEHPCLQPNRQWHVPRQAVDMADCCGPLLASGRHIKLVDPHFDAGTPRFRRPFLELLKRVKTGSRVDVFRGDSVDSDYIIERVRQTLLGRKPEGIEVRLFLRPQAQMHNRFVLCETGGLCFQIGLDDQDGSDRTDDLVTLLERGPWRTEWDIYRGDDSIDCWP